MNTILNINYKKIKVYSLLCLVIATFVSCSNDSSDDVTIVSVFKMTNSDVLGKKKVKITFNKNFKPSQEELTKVSNYTVTASPSNQTVPVNQVLVNTNSITLVFNKNLTEGLYTLKVNQIQAEDNTKLRDNDFNFYFETYPEQASIEIIEDAFFKITFPNKINQQESYKETKFSIRRNGVRLSINNIYGSDNVIFISLKGLASGENGRIANGKYKVIAFEMVFDNGEKFTKKFEFEHNTRIIWKKITNVKVKTTTNPSDPRTWTFYNLKGNKTYNLNSLEEIEQQKWDLAFALDGYSMRVCYKITHKMRGEISANTRKASDEFIDLTTRSTDWCEKDAPNLFELNIAENTSVPFKILGKNPGSIRMSVPDDYTDINNSETPVKDGYLIITDIYGGSKPNTIPSNYVYNLTLYYMFPLNKFEKIEPFPIDID